MRFEEGWDLPVAFYFQVMIDSYEVAFKEVTGLDSELDVETIREGGTNDFEYKLPKQIKHGNLVLKRALQPLDSPLIYWVKSTLESDFTIPIFLKDIKVSLLDEGGRPIYVWTCTKSYPVKWSVEPLDSEKNALLIESLEFAYQTLKRG